MSTAVLTSNDPFNILALSGGGYKGLYTARIISRIEKRTGKPFGSHFDLICGTSVGGIIALAMATRDISAKQVEEMLMSAGPQIFTPVELPSFKFARPTEMCAAEINKRIYKHSGFTLERGITAAKHANEPLKQALEDVFGDRKIRDLKTRVLIPTANWTKGAPQFFKTPHNPRF
ncbi:MAG: hypothetical protein GXP17_03620, partial [Gammaproteobacteria bacterium]|nr:hypothetical protein [Gammaproteobacteria bacterium]